MELVGRTVKKEFLGFGIFTGTVKSFDPSTGFFNIVYEDGDSEDMEFKEVVSIVVKEEMKEKELAVTQLIQTKKRPRGDTSAGNFNGSSIEDSFSIEGTEQVKDSLIDVQFSESLKNGCKLGGNSIGNTNVSVVENLNETLVCVDGLNANKNLNKTAIPEVSLRENASFDGGLKGNDGIRSVEELPKIENDWNTNFGYQEETKMKDLMVDEDFKKIDPIGALEVTQEKGSIGFDENVNEDALSGEDRDLGGGPKVKPSGVSELMNIKYNNTAECYSKESNSDDRSGLNSMVKEEQSSKKRRINSENMKSTKGPILRRSSRRISSNSSLNNVLKMEESSAVEIALPPPNTNILSDGLSVVSGHEVFMEQNCLPPKLELPPSSKHLNLDDIPILDLFSVYSCLRSFSVILFLSPFDLESFVASLKYKFPNSLIDSIHVSILETLKLQLEFLSNEGSQSASNCLRSLNWGLLDLITWPVYMVEYLLIHGSGLKPGFELNHLKLLNTDYYKQPPSVKVEILRCLCDDLLEAEVIRSELNRRTLTSELDMDVDRITNIEMHKKRKHPIDELGDSCLTQELVDETTDWNSDECCLCKMDGSLICCDGCPAAYHSRCVGIVKDLLPEGDWYCPECVMDKHDPSMKSSKSVRGADLLGVDPYGRAYFCSCGYLLVSDSSETESSFYYYHRDDWNVVIEVLKSSYILYSCIINAISMKWTIPVDSGAKDRSGFQSPNMNAELDMDGQASLTGLSSVHVPPSNMDEVNAFDVRKQSEISSINEGLDHQSCKVVQSVRRSDSATAIQFMEMASPFASSEGSTEISQAVAGIQVSLKSGVDCSKKSAPDQIENPENTNSNANECALIPKASIAKQKQNAVAPISVQTLSLINSGKGAASSHMQFEYDYYVNYYSFARLAASIAGELMSKSPDSINEDPKRSDEEIVAAQMNLISKKVTRFRWPNIQRLHLDAEKESCGWCFFCKKPTDSEDCLFSMTEKTPDPDASGTGSSSKRNKETHLTTIIHHILSIEERLSGLLSGPWHNPHYRKQWRKSVHKASNVASLKHFLVILESNLRRVALSADWLKVVDSVVTVGSASHALIRGQESSSKHGTARKRAKFSHTESSSTSNAAAKSGPTGIFWWRGGRVSRQVFHCKVLPRSLAVKGGRQAGCGKIPTLVYLDNSEFARRTRYVAWRAAVEMSTSVTQLACQVREFDMNIRWDDLENSQHFSRLDKEYKKLFRLFKKVSIRRKYAEGTHVKYLLDFGKRKTIPDSVIRHGVMLELSASERKKYWLDESHVPLNILKAFEEKKLIRMSNKTKPGLFREEAGKLMKKTSRKRGLSYLLSKSENYQCGQCNKDVPVREAVSCKDCEGFFHKKHFRKSKGTSTSDCTYTCHKCQNQKHVKKPVKIKRKVKKGKPLAQEKPVKPLAREKPVKPLAREKPFKPLAREKPVKPLAQENPLVQSSITGIAGRPRRSILKVNYAALQNKQLFVTKNHKHDQSLRGITTKHKQGQSKGITNKHKQGLSKKGITKKHEEGQTKKGITKKMVCWHKVKRTQVHHAFWLNGLLFTKKPDDARVMDFREKKLLLPDELSKDVCIQPSCCLCCESEYTSTLAYVSCENCQEWFHRDAFLLNVESTVNIIGFRCHKCRKRSPPVCPHLVDTAVPCNINGEKSDTGVECVKEGPDCGKFPSGKDEHRFPPNDGAQGIYHTYVRKQRSDADSNSYHDDQKACDVPNSNKILFPGQTLISTETEMVPENGLNSVQKEQKVCGVLDSLFQDQNADTLHDFSHTPLSKACENQSENGHLISVGSLPGARSPSCKSFEDIIETEVQIFEHNNLKDGCAITTANPVLLVPATVGVSTELQPQSTSSLTEQLDTGGTQV